MIFYTETFEILHTKLNSNKKATKRTDINAFTLFIFEKMYELLVCKIFGPKSGCIFFENLKSVQGRHIQKKSHSCPTFFTIWIIDLHLETVPQLIFAYTLSTIWTIQVLAARRIKHIQVYEVHNWYLILAIWHYQLSWDFSSIAARRQIGCGDPFPKSSGPLGPLGSSISNRLWICKWTSLISSSSYIFRCDGRNSLTGEGLDVMCHDDHHVGDKPDKEMER